MLIFKNMESKADHIVSSWVETPGALKLTRYAKNEVDAYPIL
jgi:hypothetical protein